MAVPQGNRNHYLLRRALQLAADCETIGELENKVAVANEAECDPPLPFAEVQRVVGSAWNYEVRGTNMVGRGRHVVVPEARLLALAANPDAFLLDARMRLEHEGLRRQFKASPKGMATGGILPGWPANRYRKAIHWLVDVGEWTRKVKGGRGPGDPSEYAFADRSHGAGKGATIVPNTNKTLLPPVPNEEDTKVGVSTRKAA
jgi:hypothetical protein